MPLIVDRLSINKSIGSRVEGVKQLKPDEVLNVVRCSNFESLEKELHKKFKKNRIPQTEYFRLTKSQIEQVNIEMTKGANF